jgi:hypothetical protein
MRQRWAAPHTVLLVIGAMWMPLRIVARAAVGAALLVILTSFVPQLLSSTYAQLIINEFRVRGPNGANDEYVEIY